MITKCANPGNAQLGDSDSFTVRYGRQSVYELEVLSDILRRVVILSRAASE